MRKINESIPASAILAVMFIIMIPAVAHSTFSIVAVDTVTGAVGGAGASCIANSQIINDIIEGIGAVHTQAYYNSENQANAHNLLGAGHTPDYIISWLVDNDAEGEYMFRQYGVVTLAGPGSSAAFTGNATTNWKGHLTGPGYAIQGNILLSQQIVDTMEFAYLNTPSPLEEKLMAALEAANVPGADTRCFSCNKPAISAFIKVVHLGDGGTPFLHKVVANTICEENPIDSLRILYDAWVALRYADADLSTIEVSPLFISGNGADTAVITVTPLNYDGEPPSLGVDEVTLANTGDGMVSAVTDNGDGTFSASITAPESPGSDTITAAVTAGGQAVDLNQSAVLNYFLCGDANGSLSVNLLDVTFLINYLYKDGTAPDPVEAADANGSGNINLLDVNYLINYLYKEGPEPIC